MDVETAFLNGKVLSEVYVKQPVGYDDGTDNVYKLNKALYSLRESPRACSGTRPDISFSVNYLSRFQNSYYEMHFKYVLRFLKYVYSTRELKLKYCKSNNADILDCFVDADWAGDIVDRKSTTGFFIRFFGNSISWKSKKQNSVTKSSTFAEYIALSEAVTEVNFKLFKQGNIEVVKIESENNIAVYLQKH
ncbi:unnamed protein product [Euphydryas editha]|uniref:Reverse transcriptase Ty1/copia-type domain-containing protein n=1 Tax=Euphydryas editha TaxID=104508 RepID=A0AAU9VCR6_EUPED|nr:unnamed protein product [Euphydryas editha]